MKIKPLLLMEIWDKVLTEEERNGVAERTKFALLSPFIINRFWKLGLIEWSKDGHGEQYSKLTCHMWEIVKAIEERNKNES
jgi:hypothetical protein